VTVSRAEILSERLKGRQPFLQVMIDLTTLEKAGKFKALESAGQRLPRKTRITFGCGVRALLVGGEKEWSFRVCPCQRRHFISLIGIKNGQIFTKKINQALQGSNGFGRYRLW
jgi:hypothetical protein